MNICIKTESQNRLQKVIEILNAFGIQVQWEFDVNHTLPNDNSQSKFMKHIKKESTLSELLGDKNKDIDFENLESFEQIIKEANNSKENKTIESCDWGEIDTKEYALSNDENEESFEKQERDQLGLNQPHQIWNIQISELRKYIKQLEEENQIINKRLEEQIQINQDLEKKNILLNSNYTNKLDEVEILKKWMNENTEITKDLKAILSGVSNSFDVYHTFSNDRALSWSSNAQRFNPYNTNQSNGLQNSYNNLKHIIINEKKSTGKRTKSLSKTLRKWLGLYYII